MTADAEKSRFLASTAEPHQQTVIAAALLPTPPQADERPPSAVGSVTACPVIHLIEDNPAVREDGRDLFESAGWEVHDYFSAEEFLAGARPSGEACLVIDVMLPEMSGLAMLELLRAEGCRVPAIMLTGRGDAATAVAALKAGAADYIEKPADRTMLLASVADAMERARDQQAREHARAQARNRFGKLTPREYHVMTMVLEGTPNKIIASEMGINQRTVENHRANLMRKTGAPSLPALVRLFLEASGSD